MYGRITNLLDEAIPLFIELDSSLKAPKLTLTVTVCDIQLSNSLSIR